MQEAVRSAASTERGVLPSLMEVLEARERKAAADRQLQEEKYLRRTQRILDYHERQRRSAAELRRCVEFVSSHALVLESVLRGAGGGAGGSGAGGEVPLGAPLVRQAAALQRCMAQCVANAAAIRAKLHPQRRPLMDTVLAKMECELSSWTAFLQRVVDATYSHELVVDNLHNMIAEQRRCVREVCASSVFTALCGEDSPSPSPPAPPPADAEPAAETPPAESAGTPRTPAPGARRAEPGACSTPIARD